LKELWKRYDQAVKEAIGHGICCLHHLIVNERGNKIGSSDNKFLALCTNEEVRAFLEFSHDGINLQQNHLTLLQAVKDTISSQQQTLQSLLGQADYPKAIQSFLLFQRSAQSPLNQKHVPNPYNPCLHHLCTEILEAIHITLKLLYHCQHLF
jgi:hypothetical protein